MASSLEHRPSQSGRYMVGAMKDKIRSYLVLPPSGYCCWLPHTVVVKTVNLRNTTSFLTYDNSTFIKEQERTHT